MTEPPDLRDLVGDDLPEDDLARLERVDGLLRSVPGPPAEVPPAVTAAVRKIGSVTPLWTRRRLAGALALAAALSALFFGIGFWTGGDEGFEARAAVALRATEDAPSGAWARIEIGPRDPASGNWEAEVEVAGLPPLPEGGYYALWLARDGKYAAPCTTFDVAAEGTTIVRMNASYRLAEFDEWVVTAWLPGRDNEKAPWLLRASTTF